MWVERWRNLPAAGQPVRGVIRDIGKVEPGNRRKNVASVASYG
jgi:hypothetical protein